MHSLVKSSSSELVKLPISTTRYSGGGGASPPCGVGVVVGGGSVGTMPLAIITFE